MTEFETLPKTTITEKPFGDGEIVFTIEQDNLLGDTALIDLHPMHLANMCKRASIASDRDREAQQTIAALKRRLKVLSERIEYLRHHLANCSDSKHADLSFEQDYALATAQIAAEFMAESGLEYDAIEA